MNKIAILSILFIFAGPMDLSALRDHPPALKPIGSGPPIYPLSPEMRARLKMPMRMPVVPGSPGKPVHPIYPGDKPGKPGHGHPRYWWPASTTTVRETQPVIIVNNPPPAAPAALPEPQKAWVPPLIDTRTEPGHWDYGIRKKWMGDHWRYEQDFEDRKWVPESQVEYVKQEGYWKFVE